MCSANIGEDRLSPLHSVSLHMTTLFFKKFNISFNFPFKLKFFWAPLAHMSSKRRSSSLVVFGNGRTHTGEVDGSGGSRLANYCLRAPIKWRPQRRPKWRNAGVFFFFFGWGSLGQWVSGWRCRRVGWNYSFPPHPSLKAPVTLWFAGLEEHVLNLPKNQCMIQQKVMDFCFEISHSP